MRNWNRAVGILADSEHTGAMATLPVSDYDEPLAPR
jgi:hypothetical protein